MVDEHLFATYGILAQLSVRPRIWDTVDRSRGVPRGHSLYTAQYFGQYYSSGRISGAGTLCLAANGYCLRAVKFDRSLNVRHPDGALVTSLTYFLLITLINGIGEGPFEFPHFTVPYYFFCRSAVEISLE